MWMESYFNEDMLQKFLGKEGATSIGACQRCSGVLWERGLWLRSPFLGYSTIESIVGLSGRESVLSMSYVFVRSALYGGAGCNLCLTALVLPTSFVKAE